MENANQMWNAIETSELIINACGNLMILVGLFLIFTTLIGVKKLQDPISKIHATGVSDSFGIPLCYFGFFILNIHNGLSLKYIILICLTITTGPLISQSIAYFIYSNKQKIKTND
ncbi:MAG: monovalent cation/H(+) antiporter subunit G [Rickettsiaceae bacterium]|nr:monovalent cation/H(+) antiporter subunit G [Rickettsiaceae bacterium]